MIIPRRLEMLHPVVRFKVFQPYCAEIKLNKLEMINLSETSVHCEHLF